MINHQRYFGPEEIEEHLRAGTWRSLRADDRVHWFHERGWTSTSVWSYLRSRGHRPEARELWDVEKERERSQMF
jgi:hypothetical protein